MAHTETRDPIFLGETYEWCKKIVKHWTLDDVNEIVADMQHYMKLTREKAVAKFFVDMVQNYILLYEYFNNIPNFYEKFKDEQGRPACITKLAVWYDTPSIPTTLAVPITTETALMVKQ
jgi:hypothetical protein